MIDAVRVRAVAVGRQPAFLIIVAAGFFHFYRGAPVDGVIFLALAAALLVGEGRTGGPKRVPRLPAALVIAGCAVFGWLVGHLVPASRPVVVAVALPGVVALPFVWRVGARRAAPAGRWRWLWAAVAAAICLWELTAFLLGDDRAHPTMSDILDPVFASSGWRSVLLALWLAGGVALVNRLREPADD